MKNIISLVRILFLGLFIFLISQAKMMLWFAIYGVGLIAAIFFGRIYCGYACPMNTLMIPTEWLSKNMKWQTKETPKWLQSGKLPWIALVGSIIVMLFAKRVLHKNIPILLFWIFVSVFLTLRYKPAVFHNLLCPFGAPQKVFGRYAKFSTKVNKQTCIGCKVCEKVCPTEAILVKSETKKADIKTSLCLQCNSCQQVCPKDCIYYSNKELGVTSGN